MPRETNYAIPKPKGNAEYNPRLFPLMMTFQFLRADRRLEYTRVLPTHCTRGCGCNGHPAFPAPSVFGRRFQAQLGRIARRERGLLSCRHCEERSNEAIHSFFA